jgi:hypothetical protein
MVPSYFEYVRKLEGPASLQGPGSRECRDLNFLWPRPNSHESSVSFIVILFLRV